MRRSNRSRVDVSRFAAVAGSSLSPHMAPRAQAGRTNNGSPPARLRQSRSRPGGVPVSMHLDTAMTARRTEWRTVPFA